MPFVNEYMPARPAEVAEDSHLTQSGKNQKIM